MKEIIKKAILFIFGFLVIPSFLGYITAFLLTDQENYKKYISLWEIIYIISFILFPILHRGKLKNKVPNEYIFYLIIYTTLFLLFLLTCFLF